MNLEEIKGKWHLWCNRIKENMVNYIFSIFYLQFYQLTFARRQFFTALLFRCLSAFLVLCTDQEPGTGYVMNIKLRLVISTLLLILQVANGLIKKTGQIIVWKSYNLAQLTQTWNKLA